MEDQTQKKKSLLFPTYKENRNDTQDSQCTYNVTLGRVRATTVAV
jgi:hypothetical protein